MLAALAAGCAGSYRSNAGANPHRFEPWQPVASAQAGVTFGGPTAPEILAARERLGLDGVRIYDAVLANQTSDFGENRLLVALRPERDHRPLALDTELVTFDFTPATVDRNFGLLLKGARRTSDPAPRRNRYGPYYWLAAEYPGSSRCIYAWQEVEGAALGFGRAGGEAAVQLRYCDPRRTPGELIEMYDAIVLNL